MSDRRSARAKTVVNYARIAADLSDDDFADTTPPPSKKTKSEDKTKRQKLSASTQPALQLESSLRSKKTRKHVIDRHFDKQLEEALQLSMVETGGSQTTDDDSVDFSAPPLLSPIITAGGDKHHQIGTSPPALVHIDPSSTSTQVKGNDKGNVNITRNYSPDKRKSKVDWLDKAKGNTKQNHSIREEEDEDFIEKKKDLASKLSKKSSNNDSSTTLNISFNAVLDGSINVLDNDKVVEKRGAKRMSRRSANNKKSVIESDEEDGEASDFAPDNSSEDSEEEENDDQDDEDNEEDAESESDDNDFSPKAKKNLTNKKTEKKLKKKISPNKKSQVDKLSNIRNKKMREKDKPNISSDSMSVLKSKNKMKSPFTPEIVLKEVKSNTKTTPVTKRSSLPSPPQSVTHSSPAILTAKWKPPSFSNISPSVAERNTVNSPGSGIRLGLSRNQRLKPLHSNVRVT